MNDERNDIIFHISMKKLIENKISIEGYLFAFMINKWERAYLREYYTETDVNYEEVIISLINEGFLKFTEGKDGSISVSDVETTDKFINLALNHFNEKGEKVEDWFDEWYDLWPKGVKSGGYYLRTDKRGSLRKMKEFVIDYPFYTKEIIIKATKNYLADQQILGFSHTKLAPYFIYKEDMSILAGECENISDSDVDKNQIDYAGEEL